MPANLKYWIFRIRYWPQVRTQVSRSLSLSLSLTLFWHDTFFQKNKMRDLCYWGLECLGKSGLSEPWLLRRPTAPQQSCTRSGFSLALNVFLPQCFCLPHSSRLPFLFPPFPQSASHAKCRPLQTAKGGEELRQSLFSPLSCILHAHMRWRS